MTLRSKNAYLFCLMLSGLAAADNNELADLSVYYLGGLLSDDDQYSAEISADYLLANDKWLALAAVRAETRGAFASFPGSSSTAFDMSFGQRLKTLQYSAGASWIEDEGLGSTAQYRGAFGAELDDWSLKLTVEWRDTAYHLSNFDALLRSIDEFLEDQLQQQLQSRFPQVDFNNLIALQAELDIRSLVYSLDIAYSASDSLSVFGAYTHFDYRDAPDRVQISAGLNRFGDTDRGQRVLAQINRALINSVDGLAGDFRHGFYARSASVGLDVNSGNHSWLFEYAHDKDAITGEAIRSAGLQWIAPLGEASDLRIAVGHRRAETLGNSNQISVGVFFYR
ncbi:MAG: hypothetical protein AAF542_02445 [Pseudomonadota bacterium]